LSIAARHVGLYVDLPMPSSWWRKANERRPHPAPSAQKKAAPNDTHVTSVRHHHLFAALSILDGTVIGRNMQRHRHQSSSLPQCHQAQVPARKAIHAIVDNYATHKHPKVRQWLARHPRWTFHFTPTSASWLNAVEGFFAKLTQRRLKRGVFVSVVDLQETINRFVVEHNAEPKPFIWTADPNKIIQAVRRGHQVLDSVH
jgi:transposase